MAQMDDVGLMAQMDDVGGVREPTGEVKYLSTELWFCTENGLCPPFTGTTPVLVDGAHLTAAYSRRLSPVLTEALLSD
jgi:SGNH domain (fused to AT3 domains)